MSRTNNAADREMRTPHTPRPAFPSGYKGPARLKDGRLVYWTGRVAIGLRHGLAPARSAA